MFLACITKKQIFTGAIFSIIAATSIGWAPSGTTISNPPYQLQDTVPGKNRNKNYERGEPKDIDQRIDQLEKGLENLNKQLQGKDFEKMERKLEESLSKIDVNAIQQKVEEALKKVDFSKIQLEAAEAIKKIDLQKIQLDIQKAIEEAKDKTDVKKLQLELKESMKEVQKSIEEAKKIDYKKLEKELEKSREQWQKEKVNIKKELQEAKKEIINNKGTLQKELSEARDEIQNTKATLQSYKKMITRMDNEGLLNSKDDYSIDYQEGSLLINGKKQTQEIFDSYKSYFKNDNTHIKNQKGNFSINTDN